MYVDNRLGGDKAVGLARPGLYPASPLQPKALVFVGNACFSTPSWQVTVQALNVSFQIVLVSYVMVVTVFDCFVDSSRTLGGMIVLSD